MTIFLTFKDPNTGIPDSSSSCGGSLPLSYSFPSTSFSTPFYYHPSNFEVYIDCWWYIHGPSGEEVQLTILDYWTHYEEIYIYDHPDSTSSSYLVATLSGNSSGNATVVESSRGGLMMIHTDYSYAANGRGILAEIIIAGIILPKWNNSSRFWTLYQIQTHVISAMGMNDIGPKHASWFTIFLNTWMLFKIVCSNFILFSFDRKG